MGRNSEMSASKSVREIFTAALDCDDSASRVDLLDAQCGGDAELRGKVDALLEEAGKVGEFLERPAVRDETRELTRGAGENLLPGESPGDQIGPYHLIELVGEGGGGSVYLAEQREPMQRTVALKILKLGMDTRSVIQRFEIERQSIAVMDHPNIARVLDAGASPDGRPYFVMDFVEGEPITDYCDAKVLPVRDRVELFIKVCRAVEHAHQKGIIHRDLKPSNILVCEQDGEATPKVIDFGVAKAVDPMEGDRSLTMSETVIGTPAYMSPEQASRDRGDIDTRSDVYSLGVLLYELLTGYTPLDGSKVKEAGIDDLRKALRDAEPYRPSLKLRHSRVEDRPRIVMDRNTTKAKLEAEVQGDLDWIVMKCLERDRTRRFGSASEFASDLECYLQGVPVTASPPSASDRLSKFVRRNKTAVAAGMVLLLILVASVVVSTGLALRARRAEREIREAHRLQSELREAADRGREDALRSAQTARLHEYVADINVSRHALRDGHIAKALNLLERQGGGGQEPDLRGFEWRYLAGRCLGEPHRNLPGQDSPIMTLAFSPDGDLLAIGTRKDLLIWDLVGDRLRLRLPGAVEAVVFFPDGDRVATSSRSGVWIHDLDSGDSVRELRGQGAALAVSPNGDLLATSDGRKVTLWDTLTWQRWRSLPGASGPLSFSPEGDLLAAGSSDGIVLWWLVDQGKSVTLEDSAVPLRGLFPGGKRIMFSRDGNVVIAPHVEKSARGVFYLGAWDSETGKELGVLPESPTDEGHSGVITSLSLDNEGTLLASSSWDHSVRLWDFESRRLLRTLHGHRGEVWCTALSPQGELLASGSKDGGVMIWPTAETAPLDSIEGRWQPLGFSKDSRYVGALNREGGLSIFNLDTRKVIHEIVLESSDSRFARYIVSISDDLTALAEALPDGVVRLRRLNQAGEIGFPTGSRRLDVLEMSPDAQTLVTVGWRDDLAWWDLNDPEEPMVRISGSHAVFSEDGGTLVTVTREGYSIIWDVKSRKERVRIDHGGQSFGSSAALSPDGRILAMTYGFDDFENAVSLWDTSSGKHLGTLAGHKQTIWSLAFTPDGKTLATSSSDGTLRLWNVKSRRELLSIEEPGTNLSNLRFSPDGNFLVGGAPLFASPGELRIIHAPPITFDEANRELIP
jgi:WD40 repeat protein/serine/threonine protein kinase